MFNARRTIAAAVLGIPMMVASPAMALAGGDYHHPPVQNQVQNQDEEQSNEQPSRNLSPINVEGDGNTVVNVVVQKPHNHQDQDGDWDDNNQTQSGD